MSNQTHICEVRAVCSGDQMISYYEIVKTVASRSAVRVMNLQAKKFPDRKFAIIPVDFYNQRRDDFDPMVQTTNMLNPGSVVMIRASQKGGCCDPGTERYHSM